MKRLEGFELNRHDSIKLSNARSDIIKFIPFILLCIIPGTCLLLPIFLIAFPNMLPSSFETKQQRNTKHHRAFVIRSRISSSLINEYEKLIDINIENKEVKELSKEKLIEKYKNVEMMDKVLLQNMNSRQLMIISKYFKMFSYYPQYILRMRLMRKMNFIKKDDKLIMSDGIESMTNIDLEDACEERGMKYEGLNKEEIKTMIKNWVELSVKHTIPVSYLFFCYLNPIKFSFLT